MERVRVNYMYPQIASTDVATSVASCRIRVERGSIAPNDKAHPSPTALSYRYFDTLFDTIACLQLMRSVAINYRRSSYLTTARPWILQYKEA